MAHDIIIIGGGHNGLVAAGFLAKDGHKVLVLERSSVVGGAAVTTELGSGFKVPAAAHLAALFEPVIDDLGLERHGLMLDTLDPVVFAPTLEGKSLLLWRDLDESLGEIRRAASDEDAKAYRALSAYIESLRPLMMSLLTATPPSLKIDGVSDIASEAMGVMKVGWNTMWLGDKTLTDLLRHGPMCIADFASEWFQSPLMRAVLAARGIVGTFAGPWSAGTTCNYLVEQALRHGAGKRGVTVARGGMGSITQAMAKAITRLGVEIRTGAEVRRVRIEGGRTRGVELVTGEVLESRVVVSNADPKRTFLKLVEPTHLDPRFIRRIKSYRARGTMAKINLALRELPDFTCRPGKDPQPHHKAPIHIGETIDDLERAYDTVKYGRMSDKPYLEAFIPSTWDPSLAPAGKHVMSIAMQFAPYNLKDSLWAEHREELGDRVVKQLSAYAPNLEGAILHREVLTPADLEERFALTGGHPYHGEPALDQFFLMRPVAGAAQYRTPVPNLYLCGAGTHPGGGVHGLCGYNAAHRIMKDWARGDVAK